MWQRANYSLKNDCCDCAFCPSQVERYNVYNWIKAKHFWVHAKTWRRWELWYKYVLRRQLWIVVKVVVEFVGRLPIFQVLRLLWPEDFCRYHVETRHEKTNFWGCESVNMRIACVGDVYMRVVDSIGIVFCWASFFTARNWCMAFDYGSGYPLCSIKYRKAA